MTGAGRGATTYHLPANRLADLLQAVADAGYQILGPQLRDHAIHLEPLTDFSELPKGLTDNQSPGSYRLGEGREHAYFDYVVASDSWKKYLFPARETLLQIERDERGMRFTPVVEQPGKRAFLGIRACDLKAIAVQDRVFMDADRYDAHYAARRDDILMIAVQCGRSASTCFCASMGNGPRATNGFDLALTELVDENAHRFVVESGSAAGQDIIDNLLLEAAPAGDLKAADQQSGQAAQQQRSMSQDGLKTLINDNLDNENFFADLQARCLGCGNCTTVCPTCFCSSMEDSTSLTGDQASRERVWDSCYNVSHSYLVGGSVRDSIGSRYRQWFSHKLASWQDQFGEIGCVGCGRCLTWCPVGIDITAEVDRLRDLGGKT